MGNVDGEMERWSRGCGIFEERRSLPKLERERVREHEREVRGGDPGLAWRPSAGRTQTPAKPKSNQTQSQPTGRLELAGVRARIPGSSTSPGGVTVVPQ